MNEVNIQIPSENPNEIISLTPFHNQFGKRSLKYFVNKNPALLAIFGLCTCKNRNTQLTFEAKQEWVISQSNEFIRRFSKSSYKTFYLKLLDILSGIL